MARSLCLVEMLESRTLLSTSTLVELNTTLGLIDVRLTDDVTPNTVTNFLNYVNSGRYNNTIFHRDSGNVIQAGGYTSPGVTSIATDAPIANEFQSGITTNIRGTIGMAKGSPDGATSQFFFNLVDNSSSFDNPLNQGGFTTFGTVTSATLSTMDAIGALPVSHFNPPFDAMPLINFSGSGLPVASNFVIVKSAKVLGVFTDTVTFGDSSAVKAVIFTDGDGTVTTLGLRGGTGTITFGGSEVFESISRGRAIITGTNVTMNSLAITGATNAVLAIKAGRGDGSVDLNTFTAAGSMAAISAPTTHLTGTFNVSSYVGRATFGSISNASMFVSDDSVPMQLRVIGAIADTQLTDVGAIGSIVAGSWSDSSGTVSQLNANSVGRLVIVGDLAADIIIPSGPADMSITAARIGSVSGGNWFLGGNIAALAIGSTGPAWAATLGGGITRFSVGTLEGNLTASNIVSMRAVTITGANINLIKNFDGVTPALTRLAAGTITNTHIRSTDNIGAISAVSITDSFISAGINFGANSINSAADFSAAATIGAIGTRLFNNSAIIASTITRISLGLTNDAPATLPFFGVAADKISVFSAVVIDKRLVLRLLDDPAAVPGLIAAQGVTLNNIHLQLV
ncbi:hypothetical protein BH10PLA1_BH10PLA1_07740 [soil metagenome]